jgi:Kef-type K+ transport system membrane component KefB
VVAPPIAAASGVQDVLVELFAVLLAAKVGDELFRRLRQPTIVGEILAGVLIGPSVLGLVEPDQVLEVFSELGVVFLLFWVGLQTRLSELLEVGRPAALAGTLGVILPFAGGLTLGVALGESTSTSVFLGAALVATSVGITSATLTELGALRRPAGRTILGAAVLDDILAMIILAVAVGIGGDGGVDAGRVAAAVGIAVGFVGFVAIGGTRLLQRRPGLLRAPRFSESPLLPAVLLCLGLAALAGQIGLAAIIGAFLAGMVVAETRDQHPIEDEVAPLYAFLAPFFFVYIGLQVDVAALADGGTLALLAATTVLAAQTKYAGARLGAASLGRDEARLVAVGMVPRGEVGIVVAGIGAASGVIDHELFAVIVGMSILTTLAVPPVLRAMLARR